MTDIRDVLQDAVRGVGAPGLAEAAWLESRRRVTRRRRAAALGATAVVGAGAVVVLDPLATRQPPAPSPLPAAVDASRSPAASRSPLASPRPVASVDGVPVWAGPTRAAETGLPRRASALPSSLGLPPADAPALTDDPVERAVAALVVSDGGAFRLSVLGEDAAWRVVPDLGLTVTRDGGGNTAPPLRSGSVSPDGRWVAVPQPRSVVVVDVRSGRQMSWPVGNALNEGVAWSSSGDVRVRGAGTAVRVDPASGAVEQDVHGELFGLAGDLSFADGPEGRQVLLSGSDDVPITPRSLSWYGEPVLDGGRLARSYFAASSVFPGPVVPQGIAEIDPATGRVLSRVEFPGEDRWKGCCAARGWLGDRVLYVSESNRVIAVDPRSGDAALVSVLGWDPARLAGRVGIAFGPLG